MTSAESESELDCCPLFRNMSSDDRRELLELVEDKTFSEKEVILREGLTTQFLWVIIRGRCEVIKAMNQGGEHRLAVLEPGAVFGEMSFFRPGPHSASVRALSEVKVMRLSRENYNKLEQEGLKAAYVIAANTASLLAERLQKMDEWASNLVQRPEAANNHREEWEEFRAKLYSDLQF